MMPEHSKLELFWVLLCTVDHNKKKEGLVPALDGRTADTECLAQVRVHHNKVPSAHSPVC